MKPSVENPGRWRGRTRAARAAGCDWDASAFPSLDLRPVAARTAPLALAALLAVGGPAVRAASPVGREEPPLVIGVEAGPRAEAEIGRALGRVADLRASGSRRPVTIALGPGTVRLTRPIHIGPEQAGPDDAPLVLRARDPGATRVVGSVHLTPERGPLDPALAARLPPEARAHVLAYRLPAAASSRARIMAPHLLNSPSEPLSLEVYDPEGALVPAAWPKDGWATIGAVAPAPAVASFAVDPERVRRWRGEPDLWAQGYWRWGWLAETIPVAGRDADKGLIGLADPPFEGLKAGGRFRVLHALSELDGPGQWWRDEADGLLLAWPRRPDPALDVAVVDDLLAVEGASHLRIEDLAFEESRGDLVTVKGGADVVLSGGRLAWSGRDGAVFLGARDAGVEGVAMSDIGGTAVVLNGGDRAALAPGGLFLRRSRIARWARLRLTQSPAVSIGGVGADVSDNVLHDAVDSAIVIHGNDHRVLHNEIFRVLAGGTDAGAVYAGRDWTARGTLVAENFIHDIKASPGDEVKGVYLDDMTSGFTVRRNLFLRVDQAVFIGGGRDNLVEGNAFVSCAPSIHLDSRGQTWAVDSVRDPESQLRAAYAAMPVTSALWRRRYPGLADILFDEPAVAKRNRLVDNLFVEGGGLSFRDGGRAELQAILGNRGPAGMAQRPGGDLAAIAATARRPSDLDGLVDASGAPAFHLDAVGPRR